jgi:exodeoxyribonuclease VII small subunit
MSTEPNAPTVETFERSLAELEALVEKMEKGDLSLDETVKSFERSMALYQDCQGALNAAQLRVDMLLKNSDIASRVPFDPETP